MKHPGRFKQIITAVMAIILTFSALPRAVFALEGVIYHRISSLDALTSGEYVLLCGSGSAPLAYEDEWLTAVRPVVEKDTVTDAAGAVWTLTVAENGVILRDAGGTAVSPAPEGMNGILPGEYLWQVRCTDGIFSFHGISGELPMTLAQNADYGFRAYGDDLIAGNPQGYSAAFVLYKAEPETPEEETQPSSEPAQPTEEVLPPPSTEEPPTTAPAEAPPSTAPVNVSPDGGTLYIKETAAVTLSCETEGAAIFYAVSADGVTYGDYACYTAPIVLQPGFGKLYIKAYAQKEGWEAGEETLRNFTEQTPLGAGLYFGQLHAHSQFSHAAGSVQEAFSHAAAVENLDFLAVTDYSGTLDPEKWAQGKAAAEAATAWDFVGIYGYEMTWPEGSHINTFNTPEVYRAEDLNAYYAAVAALSGSVSQFNHPGDVYGDFHCFDHYSEAADRAITLLELGQDLDVKAYVHALDAGWHVAPTCSQNNHNGNWGSADNGRTAVFAASLTEAGIYDALGNYRAYATEDNDLSVVFSLDGHAMGSQLEKRDVGSLVDLTAALSDPTDGTGGTVEVVAEEGRVLSRAPAGEAVSFQLPSDHPYYFLRIIQNDGDIAVTAPIWIDHTEDIGISDFTADTAVPVQNQLLNLTLTLYNNEDAQLDVEKITFSADGETVHETRTVTRVKAGDTARYSFPLQYAGLGQRRVTATVVAALEGQRRTYEKTLTLNFQRQDTVNRIVVDASHGNAGVTQMENLVSMAAGEQTVVTRVYEKFTAQTLGNAKILIISPPSTPFEADFIALVRDYLHTGGTVILCGQSDGKDTGLHTAEQMNQLIDAMGSHMRFRDDTARDLENCGDSTDCIFPACFNTASNWCNGITENQVYSHQNGCTVEPGQGIWLVKGHTTTDSVDADGDGLPTAPRGDAVLLACEKINGGTIFAAGSIFLTDPHTGPGKNIWDESYANRRILANLLGGVKTELPLRTIAEVRGGAEGEVYRIRGYVTAGTSNPATTFPDTVYLQDDTGGIAAVPFAHSGIEIGTPVEVTGYLDDQNGNAVLEVMDWQILSFPYYRYDPQTIPNRDAMDYAARGGMLVQVSGKVAEVTPSGDSGVSRFVLKDDKGDLATVWIGDTIFSGSTGKNTLASQVKVGRTVRAMGVLHIHDDGTTVLRVRNCDEVVYVPPLVHTPERDSTNPQTRDELVPFLLAIPLTVMALILLRRRQTGA